MSRHRKRDREIRGAMNDDVLAFLAHVAEMQLQIQRLAREHEHVLGELQSLLAKHAASHRMAVVTGDNYNIIYAESTPNEQARIDRLWARAAALLTSTQEICA